MAAFVTLPHVRKIYFFTAECEAMSRLAQVALNDKDDKEVPAGFSVEYNPYESRYEGEICDLRAIPEDLVKYVNGLSIVTIERIKSMLEDYCQENNLDFSSQRNTNDTWHMQISGLYMTERHTHIMLFLIQDVLRRIQEY